MFSDDNTSETKENTNQTNLKSFLLDFPNVFHGLLGCRWPRSKELSIPYPMLRTRFSLASCIFFLLPVKLSKLDL